ncbi:MAG: glycosyltransferase family 1 protein [Pseudomonadota bacterium]
MRPLSPQAPAAPPQVTLFRDFVEDRRTSMEIYADALADALAQLPHPPAVRQVVPRAARLPWHDAPGALEMRWSRYVRYPRAAARQQGQLNHVIDHGYGHLLWTLEPERTVVTVHDIIPALRWAGKLAGTPRGSYPLLNKLSLSALRRARALISVSQSTARDLVAHCGIEAERIHVVPLGLSPRFRPADPRDRPALRARLGLPQDGRLVLISGDAFYKNHGTCLAVLRALHEGGTPVTLVRLGPRGAEWQRLLAASGLEAGVIELQHLPGADVPALYNAVDCLLFPSLYEGFGWPVLEAMACGVPVVCSNAGSLPEVAGDAALTAAPTDAAALAQAVRRCLEDAQLRAALIARGHAQAARHPWHRHAQAVLEIYDGILGARAAVPAAVSA